MNENQEKPIVEIEETLMVKTKTEFDAAHPRFVRQNSEEVRKYEQEHNYYCRECQLYFAPTFDGLRTHFNKEIITHSSIGSCFYCRGIVYEYLKRGQSNVYHNCRRKPKTEEHNH